jgi:hypothetical protein
MFDPSRPFADPARSGVSEYDPVLHGWLDRPGPQPFELLSGAVAVGLGGLLAIGLALVAVHEVGARKGG